MEELMIIDCHYHLDPGVQSIDELLKKMDSSGIDKVALMPAMNDRIPEVGASMIALLRFALVHKPLRWVARALSDNFTPEGHLKLPKGVVRIYPDPDNAAVNKAIEDYPDRFLGWIFVNPKGNNDPVAEFERWKDRPGYIGVKAHPFWHRYDPVELVPVAQKAAEAGMPLLIHVGFGSHGDYGALVHRVPTVKLILAHTGFPGYADTWKDIRDRANLFVDLSQVAYVDESTTRRAIACLGADRCLFGTDGPYGHHGEDGGFDNGYIKRRIEELVPEAAAREKIFERNFTQLIRQ